MASSSHPSYFEMHAYCYAYYYFIPFLLLNVDHRFLRFLKISGLLCSGENSSNSEN
jgi:hypothetical protein